MHNEYTPKNPVYQAYVYGNDNLVRYADHDGREIVDATGNRVQVEYNKNGSVRSIGANATADERRVINALNLTATGRAQLHAADGSDIQVAFALVGGPAPKDENSHVQLGGTNPPTAKYGGKDGRTVSVYTSAVNESRGAGKKEGKLKNLTMAQAIGAVTGHEIVHAVDKGEIAKDLQNLNRSNRETKPNQVEQRIIEESKKLK